MAGPQKKITPEDVSEFERDQLRFFLAGSDMASTLGELNPSLAWLPKLAEMKLLKNDAALAIWVERNFDNVDAVREVVANLRFFTNDSATILEYRLNERRNQLRPLFVKCWRLIIRHIRNTKQGIPQNEWFEVLSRLKRGDYSIETLERIVNVVTPKLYVERRFGWYDKEPEREIKEPSDLLTVKYEVENDFSEDDFLHVWPASVPPETEQRLLWMLTNSLERVLADAEEVGVEQPHGLSISDIDVPSVAAHAQNAYRHGFKVIVRLLAELWSRLVQKNKRMALEIFAAWTKGHFRLMHRLALFAAADDKVPPGLAADVLLRIRQGELFLTNFRVEVVRLIRKRWVEFASKPRAEIEKRIIEGPPKHWFREGVDIAPSIDRYRFELLVDLENSSVPLGREARTLLHDIRHRHAQWQITDPERVGFTIWSGGVRGVVGNAKKLKSIPAKRLVRAAKRAADRADFMEGDAWQALCQGEPVKAFQGIAKAPTKDRWHQWAWRPFFWNANKIADAATLNDIAALFVKWPKTAPFDEVGVGAVWWLNEVADKLEAPILWSAWELIYRRAPRNVEVMNDDPFGTAINDASGHLASILLKKTPRPRKGRDELSEQMRARYNRLSKEPGIFGLLVRVRLASAIAFLFERAPEWTTKELVPKFFWESPDASAMWAARKYSNYIGSVKLFELTKPPFLELFERNEPSEEDLRVFSDWLGVILIANQAGRTSYPLTPAEVRSVLRRAGNESMSSFAHRLAIDMGSAKAGEKVKVWGNIIGPVFQGAWPVDLELQSSKETFKLVQLLCATGEAFPKAVDVVLPFIRAEDPRQHTSVFSLAEASSELFASAPDRMLELLSAIAGDAPPQSVFSLRTALEKLRVVAPHLVQTRRFQKLETQASAY